MEQYSVYLWSGRNYDLTPFDVDAYDADDALDRVAAYVVNNNMRSFFKDEREMAAMFKRLGRRHEDEQDFAEEIGYTYIDATMVGAKYPIYLRTENMKIFRSRQDPYK